MRLSEAELDDEFMRIAEKEDQRYERFELVQGRLLFRFEIECFRHKENSTRVDPKLIALARRHTERLMRFIRSPTAVSGGIDFGYGLQGKLIWAWKIIDPELAEDLRQALYDYIGWRWKNLNSEQHKPYAAIQVQGIDAEDTEYRTRQARREWLEKRQEAMNRTMRNVTYMSESAEADYPPLGPEAWSHRVVDIKGHRPDRYLHTDGELFRIEIDFDLPRYISHKRFNRRDLARAKAKVRLDLHHFMHKLKFSQVVRDGVYSTQDMQHVYVISQLVGMELALRRAITAYVRARYQLLNSRGVEAINSMADQDDHERAVRAQMRLIPNTLGMLTFLK